jgi:hypothetical protein
VERDVAPVVLDDLVGLLDHQVAGLLIGSQDSHNILFEIAGCRGDKGSARGTTNLGNYCNPKEVRLEDLGEVLRLRLGDEVDLDADAGEHRGDGLADRLIAPPLFPLAGEFKRPGYDPNRAKALLAEAGYPSSSMAR